MIAWIGCVPHAEAQRQLSMWWDPWEGWDSPTTPVEWSSECKSVCTTVSVKALLRCCHVCILQLKTVAKPGHQVLQQLIASSISLLSNSSSAYNDLMVIYKI